MIGKKVIVSASVPHHGGVIGHLVAPSIVAGRWLVSIPALFAADYPNPFSRVAPQLSLCLNELEFEVKK